MIQTHADYMSLVLIVMAFMFCLLLVVNIQVYAVDNNYDNISLYAEGIVHQERCPIGCEDGLLMIGNKPMPVTNMYWNVPQMGNEATERIYTSSDFIREGCCYRIFIKEYGWWLFHRSVYFIEGIGCQ